MAIRSAMGRQHAGRRPHNFHVEAAFSDAAALSAGTQPPRHRALSLFDPRHAAYQFEIDNPTAFTQPWRGADHDASTEPIYDTLPRRHYSFVDMVRGFGRRTQALDDRQR